jgi:hypothetical protein
VLPTLSRSGFTTRIIMALACALAAFAFDPLATMYRRAAQRQLHGSAYVRQAAIEEIVRLGRDFRGMSLTEVDLSGLELSGADLRGVSLAGSDLSRTRLWGAEVEGASFDGAHLNGADLGHTALERALHLGTALCDSATRLPDGWRCAAEHVLPTH